VTRVKFGDDRLPKRFWDKVYVDTQHGCWWWTGVLERKGYGRYWNIGSMRMAHRTAYQFLIGDIPDGLTIDHLCRVTRCVNPNHFEVVTNRVNVLRGEASAARNARKSECKRGHPLSGDNLLACTGRGGRKSRQCRTCNKIRMQSYYERQLAQ